jgi:acetate kinase
MAVPNFVEKRIFVVNPGSTSLKGKDVYVTLQRRGIDYIINGYRENALPEKTNIPKEYFQDGVRDFITEARKNGDPDVWGLKTVQGGPERMGCYWLDDRTINEMREYSDLAPLHNPLFLKTMDTMKKVAGKRMRMAGNFETFYARGMPQCAKETGLPKKVEEKTGIRRYGFHGNSHFYVAERAAQLRGEEPESTSVITVHLGGSSSVASRRRGDVLYSSMGATPESTGIIMAARAGIYSGEMKYMMRSLGITESKARKILIGKSGLVGISGKDHGEDLRKLYADSDEGDDRARLALDTFQLGIAREIGAQIAGMGNGQEVSLCFTGGMSRSQRFLSEIQGKLEYFDIDLENDLPDEGVIGKSLSQPIKVFRIPTNEELVVAESIANLNLNGNHWLDRLYLEPIGK